MNIRAIRESRNVSQKALGEAIGVAENTVASWEKGRNAPPGDKVAAMARFLRCSTDELLLDDSERAIAPELQPFTTATLPSKPLKQVRSGRLSAALNQLRKTEP